MKNYFKIGTELDTILDSLKVSIVVGLLLNIVNQWQTISTLRVSEISFIKVFFTFLVPYLVSTYTIIRMKLTFHIGKIAITDVKLKCNHCNQCQTTVKKGDVIPVCNSCMEYTNWSVKKYN